jgi:hypothetical protein
MKYSYDFPSNNLNPAGNFVGRLERPVFPALEKWCFPAHPSKLFPLSLPQKDVRTTTECRVTRGAYLAFSPSQRALQTMMNLGLSFTVS